MAPWNWTALPPPDVRRRPVSWRRSEASLAGSAPPGRSLEVFPRRGVAPPAPSTSPRRNRSVMAAVLGYPRLREPHLRKEPSFHDGRTPGAVLSALAPASASLPSGRNRHSTRAARRERPCSASLPSGRNPHSTRATWRGPEVSMYPSSKCLLPEGTVIPRRPLAGGPRSPSRLSLRAPSLRKEPSFREGRSPGAGLRHPCDRLRQPHRRREPSSHDGFCPAGPRGPITSDYEGLSAGRNRHSTMAARRERPLLREPHRRKEPSFHDALSPGPGRSPGQPRRRKEPSFHGALSPGEPGRTSP